MTVGVYWQPGCTSCLRVRQFLGDHGVTFDSFNVLADPAARARLDQLGVRSVPVVTRDGEFVFAQEIDDVARFLGLPLRGARLSVPELAQRIAGLLAAAEVMASKLPAENRDTRISGRDRTYADVAFHIGQIGEAFLDAARGGELTYRYFERRAGSTPIVESIDAATKSFTAWWTATRNQLPESLATYYGRKPLQQVLERTAWHMAQHCRQLQHILDALGASGGPWLSSAILAGLPLPRDVWDPEIKPP